MSKTTSEILDSRRPANPEAEQWVVGSIILKPSVLDDLGCLRPGDFYDDTLGALYQWIHDRHRRGEPIDIGLLGQHFKSDDWAARIAEIVHAVPHAGNAVHYGRIVAQAAKFRQLQEIGLVLAQDAHRAEGEPEAVLERIETALAAVRLAEGDGEPVTLAAAAGQAIARIDEIQRHGKGAGVPTGLLTFDADQGGLFPGELTVLAARPGNGKTSLALQIADYNASQGRLVYFASLEMSAAELSIRLACGESGVSNRLVRIGKFGDGDSKRLGDALAVKERSRSKSMIVQR